MYIQVLLDTTPIPAAWGARKPQQNKLPQSWISYAAAAAAGQRNKNKETTANMV